MSIRFQIKKSSGCIPEGLTVELPDLCVLTGKNGSGKSHLFEALADISISSVYEGATPLQQHQIKYVTFGGLSPNTGGVYAPQSLDGTVNQIWGWLEEAKAIIVNSSGFASQSPEQKVQSLFTQLKAKLTPRNRQQGAATQPLKHDRTELLKQLCHVNEIDLYTISQSDFGSLLRNSDFPVNDKIEDLFSASLSELFKRYYDKRWINNANVAFQKTNQEDQIIGSALSDDDFLVKYGPPPWTYFNEVFEELKLPYKVTIPEQLRQSDQFTCEFIHTQSGARVSSSRFSTGEKVLLSLALAIYSDQDLTQIKLLILDEPDAPLHPSMIRLMLELIEKHIVGKLKIKVMLSSHSPVTIACAPAYSLFKMDASTRTPEKCDLNDSISLLTDNFQSFSLSLDQRRQVFVEQSNDVFYYEPLIKLLSRSNSFDVQPQFLPPTTHTSNCTDVKFVVSELRSKGNSHVYGLIDWDTTNTSDLESGIVVLGMEKRYAIENYLLEPYYIGLLLIHQSFKIPSDLGLQNCNSSIEVFQEVMNNQSSLQALIDNIETTLWGQSLNKVSCKLVNGWTVDIHQEQLEMQGHDLETKYHQTWPELNRIGERNHREGRLKRAALNTVINDFPMLLSQDLVETFKQFG